MRAHRHGLRGSFGKSMLMRFEIRRQFESMPKFVGLGFFIIGPLAAIAKVYTRRAVNEVLGNPGIPEKSSKAKRLARSRKTWYRNPGPEHCGRWPVFHRMPGESARAACEN